MEPFEFFIVFEIQNKLGAGSREVRRVCRDSCVARSVHGFFCKEKTYIQLPHHLSLYHSETGRAVPYSDGDGTLLYDVNPQCTPYSFLYVIYELAHFVFTCKKQQGLIHRFVY